MHRSAVFASGLLATLVVAIVWIGTGCGPGMLGSATPQEIHQAFQESLTATGKAVPDSRTQYFGMSYRSYLVWELELTLENRSKFPITFGDHMILFEADHPGKKIPTRAVKVHDVSGAGDTVIATMAVSMAAKSSLIEAATIANHAAGIVCGEVGIVPIDKEVLFQVMQDEARSNAM